MSDPPPLVLASTSPYRRALLERLGLPFEAVAPGVDETAAAPAGAAPEAVAAALARAKARAVAAARPDACVVGSDQVAALGEEALGKPGSPERARAQLARLAGREHRLWTAVHVVAPGLERAFVDRTTLAMRALDAAAIARYVERDRPLDCAGGYKLERLGVALFERVDCEDETAITGLPLRRLCAVLREVGYELP